MKIVTHTNFTPYELLNWISDAPIKPGPKSVLLALARYVQRKKNGNRVYPGQDEIAAKAQVSLRCVNGHINTLEKLGYITVEPRDVGNGYRKPNDYFLQVGFHHAAIGTTKSKSAYGHTQKTTENVSKSAYEGEVLEGDVCLKGETKGTTSPAGTSASVKTLDQPKSWGKGEALVQNFKQQCRFNENARIRFYMDLGRLYTKLPRFHKPKNPAVPLSANNIKTLNFWFEQLPKHGCEVMNFAMQNWPQLYAEVPAWWDFRNVNPLISALDKYGHKELLEAWQQSQQKRSLRLVASNVASVTDEYYQQAN